MSRARRRAARERNLTDFLNRLDREASPELGSPPPPQPQTPAMAATRAIEAMVAQLANMQQQQPPAPRPKLKTPTFNGDTDVELFITQFRDIADASAWNERDTLLQLRSCLEGRAVESGRRETTNDIYQSLRQRFGMTDRQARDKLDALRKTNKQDLFDFGNDIMKLMEIAYPDQGRQFTTRTALEKFIKGLNNSRLQQHMLIVQPSDIPDAIRAAEEFLQYETKPSVQQFQVEQTTPAVADSVTAPENADTAVQEASKVTQSLSSMMQAQSQVLQALQDQSQSIAKLVQAQSQAERTMQGQSQAIHLLQNQPPLQPQPQQPANKARKGKNRAPIPPAPCWNCQALHWRDQCPHPSQTASGTHGMAQQPQTPPNSVAREQPNKRCANCGDMRHWLYQCPHSQANSTVVHQSAPMSGNGPAPFQ